MSIIVNTNAKQYLSPWHPTLSPCSEAVRLTLITSSNVLSTRKINTVPEPEPDTQIFTFLHLPLCYSTVILLNSAHFDSLYFTDRHEHTSVKPTHRTALSFTNPRIVVVAF